jgi:hypothetical protein
VTCVEIPRRGAATAPIAARSSSTSRPSGRSRSATSTWPRAGASRCRAATSSMSGRRRTARRVAGHKIVAPGRVPRTPQIGPNGGQRTNADGPAGRGRRTARAGDHEQAARPPENPDDRPHGPSDRADLATFTEGATAIASKVNRELAAASEGRTLRRARRAPRRGRGRTRTRPRGYRRHRCCGEWARCPVRSRRRCDLLIASRAADRRRPNRRLARGTRGLRPRRRSRP